MDAAPDKKYRLPAKETSKRRELSHYPVTYNNKDKIVDLESKRPWNEYPLIANPGEVWRQRESAERGKVRAIYNKFNKSPFDVVYHDPNKGTGNGDNFNKACY